MIFVSFGAKADTKAALKKLASFSIELFHVTDFDDDDDDDDDDFGQKHVITSCNM